MKNKPVVEAELDIPSIVPMDPMFSDNPVFSFNPHGDSNIDVEDPEDLTPGAEDDADPTPAPVPVPDEDKDEGESIEDGEVEPTENPLALVASFLKEEQLVDEVPENLDPDTFKEMWQKSIDKAIEEELSDLPDETKELIEYVRRGGKQSEFLSVASKTVDYEQMDLTEERNQKLVVQEYLKSMGYDDDEIDDQINLLIDSDRLEARAEKYVGKLIEKQAKAKQELFEQQKQEQLNRAKAYEEYVTNLRSTIEEATDIAGMDISKEDKVKFRDYMTKPVTKGGPSQYVLDMKQASTKDLIALAYFKYKNFDFKDIKKKVESTKVSVTREKLTQSATKQNKTKQLDLSGLRLIHGK